MAKSKKGQIGIRSDKINPKMLKRMYGMEIVGAGVFRVVCLLSPEDAKGNRKALGKYKVKDRDWLRFAQALARRFGIPEANVISVAAAVPPEATEIEQESLADKLAKAENDVREID